MHYIFAWFLLIIFHILYYRFCILDVDVRKRIILTTSLWINDVLIKVKSVNMQDNPTRISSMLTTQSLVLPLGSAAQTSPIKSPDTYRRQVRNDINVSSFSRIGPARAARKLKLLSFLHAVIIFCCLLENGGNVKLKATVKLLF